MPGARRASREGCWPCGHCASGWGGSLEGQVWEQRCHRGLGEPWGWAGTGETAPGDPACSHKAGMLGETEAQLGKLRHEGLRSSLPLLLPALTLWGHGQGATLSCFPRSPQGSGVVPSYWGRGAFCKGMSHPVPSPGWGCPPGGMRGMWGADVGGQGGYFVGCQAGHRCSPHGIKGAVFSPSVFQKASGQLCFGGGLILPAGTGLGATRPWHPGSCGVSRVGRGCGVGV